MCAIAPDASPDGQRRALARSELQLQFCGILLLGEASAFFEDARAILAHEDAERLADEMPLADVEQVSGGAIDFENRGVWRRDDRGVRYLVEQVPVLGVLIAQLSLQCFDPPALFEDMVLGHPELLKGGTEFPECPCQQGPLIALGFCSSL